MYLLIPPPPARHHQQQQQKPQQQQPPPPPQQQQQQAAAAAAAAKAAKERVSDDCVVHVRNLDVQVTSRILHTFCTKTVGYLPAAIRMLSTRPR